MKTTLHLHRPPPAPEASPAPPTRHVRSSTVRLGFTLSIVAGVITLVLEAITDVPVVLILVPVVIIGFALSWHACGGPLAGGRADRSREVTGPPG